MTLNPLMANYICIIMLEEQDLIKVISFLRHGILIYAITGGYQILLLLFMM
jgi:hypothetical protein